MKILVTGSAGFIGKNLIAQLKSINPMNYNAAKSNLTSDLTIYEYDIATKKELLDLYTRDCDFVCHFAGVNRTQNDDDFVIGNVNFTSILLESLKRNSNYAPIIMTSSSQAELDNPYGKSKREGEKLIMRYGKENNVKTYIYRLHNVFGKWCKPNYNSAVATFLFNIANDLPIIIKDPDIVLKLNYIDDVIAEFISVITEKKHIETPICTIPTVYKASLGEITELIYSFKEAETTLLLPKVDNEFIKALHSTYLSYLPTDKFSYPLKMHIDKRGSFSEIIRSKNAGQFCVNIIKPHMIKGNHWHNTKNEKFVAVSGNGLIQFRKVGTDEIIKYYISEKKLEIIQIPVGYVHNIINTGDTDLIVLIWCNECFDENKPDTFFEEVSSHG